MISGVLWLAVWVHYLAAHGASNVDHNRTPLGLSWYDTSRVLVVSLLLVVYVVGTVRLDHGWVARVSRYGALVGYSVAALGIVVAIGVTEWGSTTLDLTGSGVALIALGTAVGGISTIVYGREAVRGGLLPRGSGLPLSLGVLFGEVVLEDAGGGCPSERSVGSVVIVEVDEPVVGGSALGF